MTGIYIILTLLVVTQALYSYYNHINIDVLKIFKKRISQHDKHFDKVLKVYEDSLEVDKIVRDRLDNFSDTLDLYKKVCDFLNDAYAQLNFRVQQLEMLNSSATLTDKYDTLNPSGVMYVYDTQVITDKPETIDFTKEE